MKKNDGIFCAGMKIRSGFVPSSLTSSRMTSGSQEELHDETKNFSQNSGRRSGVLRRGGRRRGYLSPSACLRSRAGRNARLSGFVPLPEWSVSQYAADSDIKRRQ